MAKLDNQPESAYVDVDTGVIIHHTASDVIVLVRGYERQLLCKHIENTHRISDFQVLALTGHIWNFKRVVLLNFLQRKKQTSVC